MVATSSMVATVDDDDDDDDESSAETADVKYVGASAEAEVAQQAALARLAGKRERMIQVRVAAGSLDADAELEFACCAVSLFISKRVLCIS